MHFNDYLKSCRERQNLTQEQLVQELYNLNNDFSGLDISTLSRWERGITRPSMERQTNIIHLFQKYSNAVFPCFDALSKEEIENEICMVGVHNLIGKNKQLIFNVPSYTFEVDRMKIIHARSAENIDRVLHLPHALHRGFTDNLFMLEETLFKDWALHPSNLFLVSEYEGEFYGMLFALRLRPATFDKLMNFEMEPKDIADDDFAGFDEVGSNFIFSFLAYNARSAALLFLRYFAHLIANQSAISEVGAYSRIDGAKKIVSRLHLEPYREKIVTSEHITSNRAPLEQVLITEDVLKIIFQKQVCPEDDRLGH